MIQIVGQLSGTSLQNDNYSMLYIRHVLYVLLDVRKQGRIIKK